MPLYADSPRIDDLSSLLAHQLNLSNTLDADSKVLGNAGLIPDVGAEQAIKYSISQHYHHSAHIAPSTLAVDTPASKHVETDQMTAEIILARNGVDPASLFPSQLTLFRQADVGQQMRLVELWRISPSNHGAQAYALEFGGATAAQLLQDPNTMKWQQGSGQSFQTVGKENGMSGQEDVENEMTDVSERNQQDGNASSANDSNKHDYVVHYHAAEPYMLSGYESLAKRDYDEQVRQQQQQQQQQQKATFSPLGSAVGPTHNATQYNHALDPVYHRYDAWQLNGGQEMAYVSDGHSNPVHQTTLPRASHTGGDGEDEEML